MSKIHNDMERLLLDPGISRGEYLCAVDTPDQLVPGEKTAFCLVIRDGPHGQTWRRHKGKWNRYRPLPEPYDPPTSVEEVKKIFENRINELERIGKFLWGLLDNIDTADDIAKDNDLTFRNFARQEQQRRWMVGTSDGYTVTLREGGQPQRCGQPSPDQEKPLTDTDEEISNDESR